MAGKKGTTGGPRKGAGRKPVEEKKVPITFYVRPSNKETIRAKVNAIVKEVEG